MAEALVMNHQLVVNWRLLAEGSEALRASLIEASSKGLSACAQHVAFIATGASVS